jgi:3-oxoacyl-[acyl-carrier protein] reductase
MDLGLQGRVAVVNGASRGIERAIAARLTAEGARVVVTSRNRERLEQTADAIGALALPHDSANLDDAPQLVAEVEERVGPIDILVTNTGGPPLERDPFALSREQWTAANRDLVLAPVELAALVLPGMRRRGWGRILNVGSVTVREPAPALILSNAARSAALAALKTIAREVAADGVTINTILTGMIATDRVLESAGSMERAEELARRDVPTRRMGARRNWRPPRRFCARSSRVTSRVSRCL